MKVILDLIHKHTHAHTHTNPTHHGKVGEVSAGVGMRSLTVQS